MDIVIGLLVLLAGASGAALATQRLPAAGHARLVVPALVVAGAAIGAGGALVRGWDLGGSALVGAAVVPLFAITVRLLETRRRGGAT